MKKFLPILVLILAFTGFLAVQVTMDQVQTSANQSTTVKDKNVRYENLLKTLKVKATDKKEYDFTKESKPIIIFNFWASWCSPCLKELPSLMKLATDFPDDVQVITVNTDEDDQLKMIDKIKNKFKLELPIIAENSNKISDDFLVAVIPFTVIYVNGSVYKAHQGYFDFGDPSLAQHFKSVLKK